MGKNSIVRNFYRNSGELSFLYSVAVAKFVVIIEVRGAHHLKNENSL